MNNIPQNFIPDKPFKTFEEQLNIMKSRNIDIPNRQYALDMLSSYPYSALVNGCKDAFLVAGRDDLYIDGTNFNDLVDLYFFDNDLNNIILKYTLYIETTLKTRLSYLIAQNYGVYTDIYDLSCNNPDDYLYKGYYSNSTNKKSTTLNYIKEISKAHANLMMNHYINTKNHIPPWVIITSIPYATAIDWYSILPNINKSTICNQFIIDNSLSQADKKEFLLKALEILHKYRNTIAHGSQTRYVTRNPHLPQLPKKQALTLFGKGLTAKEYNSGIGVNDLFAVFSIILTLLADEKIETNFINDIDMLIGTHFNACYCTKTLNEIYNFPEDIRNRLLLVWENKRGPKIYKYLSCGYGYDLDNIPDEITPLTEAAVTSEKFTDSNTEGYTEPPLKLVWVASGEKEYHSVGHCQFLQNKTPIQIPYGTAIALGYHQCANCCGSKSDFD